MSDASDAELLEQFARNQSETAFAELVERHIGLVYSTVLRKTSNPQQAEDITQVVFIILARKAGSLGSKTVLPGWLYHTARLTAANLQRAELRRVRREQEAFMQSTMNESAPDALWRELSPLLEDAMAGLGASDRDAIVLRYFQNRSLADVGAALGIAERAAQKRVSRALEKLRKFFDKRGVVSTTAVIAGVISSNSVQAAPVALAKSVTAVAIAQGATAGTSTLTLVKGAMKVMAWSKTKTAVTAAVFLALTATGVAGYKIIQAHRPTDLIVSNAEIGPDGIIRSRNRIEFVNSLGKTIPANVPISILDAGDIEQMTDGTGRNMKYTKEPGYYGNLGFTNLYKYFVQLNWPVPPGGKIIFVERDSTDSRKATYMGKPLIQPTGTPGEFELVAHEDYDFAETLHIKGVLSLPPGAVLLDKQPRDLMVVTNKGQVEVRFDAMLPPPNIADFRLRYRLAPAAQ